MISEEEHLEMFKKTYLPRKTLVRFSVSSRQIVALSTMEDWNKAYDKILKIEEQLQWPVLQRLKDPQSEIYEDVDKRRLKPFIRSIKEEEEIRTAGYPKMKDKMKVLIRDRVKIYKEIFDFSDEDLKYCARMAKRYEKRVARKRKKRIWKIGIAVSVGVAAAGVGTGIYFRKKHNNKK
ncbi:MAG: hypothetical protein NT136_00460 [Candidatus Moranbacteria bacterium]|nr:hypothetical protein [Candidatus Moranbacteria bacterium]